MSATTELDSDEHDVESIDDDAEESIGDSKRAGKGKIKFESVMQRTEAATYFGALVDGLRHGQLMFRHGEQHLSLAPAQQVVVEVRASRKGDKEKVAFELEWRRSADDAAPLDG
ncbi:MAG TPA: amphi-Trp domain-containing protein [Polyangiaceae bacterium]|nr:amphi-Trp domain-containing protein [Polyangiaceae bacterium]